MSSIALQAQGLSAHFGARTVLNEIDIEIRSGEVTALLGPNGAGKVPC